MPRSWTVSSSKQTWLAWEFVEMKFQNLQSLLLVFSINLWRVSSTEDNRIFGWRYRLASQIPILFLPFTFLHCGRIDRLLHWRLPLIQFLRIKSWWRCMWICTNVSRYTMCVPNAWRNFFAARRYERMSLHSCRYWMRWDWHWSTGNVAIPLRFDSANWKSFKSFIQFTSFCNSCPLPSSSNVVFWTSMSFRLAIVSNAELWNFFNSSISVRLLWWASRNNNSCCNGCPWKSCWFRFWTSSAPAASNSCWLVLAWH